jgi:hypothetical protein
VLLSIEEYRRITGTRLSLIEALGLPAGVEDAVLDITPSRDLGRAAEFD